MGENDIGEALLAVRRSYRLLQLYQRRVLDLCRELVDAMGSDLQFYYWTPSYFWPPPQRGTDPATGRWSWDFLPLYDFCVFYQPLGQDVHHHQRGDWMLVIRVSSDSGYKSEGRVEPDSVQFEDPAVSNSVLRLYLYYCEAEVDGNWFYDVFNANAWPSDQDVESSEKDGVKTLGHKIALEGLAGAEQIQREVEGFKEKCQTAFGQLFVRQR